MARLSGFWRLIGLRVGQIEEFMHSHLHSKGLASCLLMYGFVFNGCIATAYSGEMLKNGTELYRNYATINENGVVRKFVKNEPLAIQALCATYLVRNCDSTTLSQSVNDAFRRNDRIKVKFTNTNPDIQFYLTDSSGVDILKHKLLAFYFGEFQDVGDPDCQLYYSIHDNTIVRATIVVSLDAPKLKQKICLALQFPHALGLALPNAKNFPDNWPISADGLDLSIVTDKQLSHIEENLDVMIYIHMCPDLKPGMDANDIIRVLHKYSPCLQGLKRISQ